MILEIESTKNKEALNLTEKINEQIAKTKTKEGIVNIFVKHTTAALTISEFGEGTEEDLLEVVQKMIPKIAFRHGHNPSHAPDHMISSVIGQSLSLPILSEKLDLGIWQKVILLELNGPRKLTLNLTFS